MYYLRSRYYNPKHCRFINVDCLLNDGILNTNQQTYCVNNPVMLTDGSGRDWGSEDYNNLSPGCDFVNIGGCYQVNIPSQAVWSSVYSTPLYNGMWSGGIVGPSAGDIYSLCRGSTALPTNASSTLHRPYVRKGVRNTVEANATRAANGNFLDANTGLEIMGKYHLGHIYNFEYWRLLRYAEEHNFTQKQFNDFCNNPKFYQIEDPHSNMSHEYECKEEYNGLPGLPE